MDTPLRFPSAPTHTPVKIIDHEGRYAKTLAPGGQPVKIIDRESQSIAKLKNPPVVAKPASLDDRKVLVLMPAVNFKEVNDKFADGVKPGPFAKFKELIGRGSATGDVMRSAQKLTEALKANQSVVRNDGYSEFKVDGEVLADSGTSVMKAATDLTAKIQRWLDRHDHNPTGRAEGSHREEILAMRDQKKALAELIGDLQTTGDADEVKENFLKKNLPADFPINDVPRLKAMMLDHAAQEGVSGAKNPENFFRGSGLAVYNSGFRHEMSGHFAAELKEIKQTNLGHALSEMKGDPAVNGRDASKQLEDPKQREAIVSDYRALVTTLFGTDPASAREQARRLPASALENTRHVKSALDEAVKRGEITREQADSATRKLVVNNFFLRAINVELSSKVEHSDVGASDTARARSSALGKLLQNQASDVPLGAKEAHLKPLETALAPEKAKVDAFIDEILKQL